VVILIIIFAFIFCFSVAGVDEVGEVLIGGECPLANKEDVAHLAVFGGVAQLDESVSTHVVLDVLRQEICEDCAFVGRIGFQSFVVHVQHSQREFYSRHVLFRRRFEVSELGSQRVHDLSGCCGIAGPVHW
jgi:hypothetical protein